MLTRLRCIVLAFAAVSACGHKEAESPVGVDGSRAEAPRHVIVPKDGVKGHMVASIGDRTIGPFLARREGKSGMVAWVTAAEGSGRRVVVVPLSSKGDPTGGERTIANVPVDTTAVLVRPMRGPAPGYVVAWTSLTDRGEALWAAALGEDGVPRSKPTELTRTADDVVWVDVIPTDVGAVCLWAEETRGGDANVVAAALDTDGKVRGLASRVARGVVGWQALEIPGGVGVSTVNTAGGAAKKGAKGALVFHRLDAEGRATVAPATVGSTSTVSGDIEVVRSGTKFVFAWTDKGEEPSVSAASLDDAGAIEAPRKIADARGGAELLGLASGPSGVAVLWESPVNKRSAGRTLHAARLSPSLTIEGRPLSLQSETRAVPEIAPTASGFTLLTTLRDCEPDGADCANAGIVATAIRTDGRLARLQRDTFAFGEDPASIAWGMSCEGETCYALAASGGSPARIRAAEMPKAKAAALATKELMRDAFPPLDAPAMLQGESVVDFAIAPFGDGLILATLTAKGERIKRENVPRGQDLVLATRLVDANGVVSAPQVISTRAQAVGRVKIVQAEKPEDGGALAWVAIEGGDPQVHVTRVDKRGRRQNDVQLTTAKGDAGDVAIVWQDGAFVVAWIDGRDGNGEVYATRVGLDLARTVREERITNAPGDASDLVALVRGDLVWLAWADPRESPRDGMSDVFVAAISGRDAKRAIEEQRIIATAPNSRTPQIALAGDRIDIAWIEESPLGGETPGSSGYGAMWATLDAAGKLVTQPTRMPVTGDGAPTSVAIEATPAGLHAVIARATSDNIAIDGVDIGGKNRAFPMFDLMGPPSLDVALVLHDGVLYTNDDGPAPADKRLRRAKIPWERVR